MTRNLQATSAAVAVLLLLCCVRGVRADESSVARASALMRKGMHRDAAKVLQATVDANGPASSVSELRMLGECYYLQQEYAKARPFFSRALRQTTSDRGKAICESRLAVIAYRLNDFKGAREKIETFLRDHPQDRRAGTLYVVRIKMNSGGSSPLAEKIRLVELDYRAISGNKKVFGYYNAALAGQVLGELYIRAGKESEAVSLFITVVHEMRGLINARRATGESIPRDLMQGVDTMSLQVGRYYMGKKDWAQATKWLENVDYVDSLVAQAKLMLAQASYQQRDLEAVTEILSDSFMRSVPPGELRSNMYLVLGFTAKEMKKPDLERAKEMLKQVQPGVPGYPQARHGLGDIYRAQGDPKNAEAHYLASVKVARYAPAAHFYLARIYRDRAERFKKPDDKTKARRAKWMQKAMDHYDALLTKYPLTAMANEARESLKELESDGVKRTALGKPEDKLKAWEAIVQNHPNSSESAQALMSLAQHHSRALYDPSGTRIVKPPNWLACAAACRGIIDRGATPFDGVTVARWEQFRTRALYFLGRSELGSLPLAPSERRLGGGRPIPLAGGGSAARAATHLRKALTIAPESDKEFRKDIELALMEAMFKSDDAQARDLAEKRYMELEPLYGADPRYQKLTLALADWLTGQSRYAEAAKTYRTIARKADLSRDEVMHLLYLAGVYYNKGARTTTDSPDGGGASLGFHVYPQEIIEAPTPTKTHPPFQQAKRIYWEQEGRDPLAMEVLRRVSKRFAVPFVWSRRTGRGSVNAYLGSTRISRAKLQEFRQPKTLNEYMSLILDLDTFRLDFDLGVSGGTTTIDTSDPEAFETAEHARVIEIFNPVFERFPALAKPYGDFAALHAKGAMMFHIVERIEEASGSRVFWAEGVDKEDVLAREYRVLPGPPVSGNVACNEVLRRVLEPIGLAYRAVQRDRTGELIRESNDCFNELRKFGENTVYAEEALFNLAVNFYYVEDYGKLKLVLREYLKVFDDPSHTHYHDACFWLGRAFERERRFHEAVKYYARAAEETVILYKRDTGSELPEPAVLKEQLGYDNLYNLSIKVSGSLNNAKLGDEFLRFIRFNTNVELKLDPTAQAVTTAIHRVEFKDVACFDLLYDAMRELDLGMRTENANAGVAEKAYMRLATVCMKDDLAQQALEHVETLLARYPETRHELDAIKLKLDIYKRLKDYSKVLDSLEALRKVAGDTIESFKLDYEAGRIYFDMCDYAEAVKLYTRALSASSERSEWLKIREGLAHAYLRQEDSRNLALSQFRDLMRYEGNPLRHSIHTMMVAYLEYVLKPEQGRKPLPQAEAEFIAAYEAMSDRERAELSRNDLAKATWIYYAVGMQDLHAGEMDSALLKFDAASVSPDSSLAGESLIRIAQIHMRRGEYAEARSALEHLLFATKAVEPTVRATYHLGRCLEELSFPEAAIRRYNEIVEKFPISPYAKKVLDHPFYQEQLRLQETEAQDQEIEAQDQEAVDQT